ncbi:MAG: zinc ribbon domain-containing protein [Acidobacteriota bacterium]|nr:zinc ribbon domain-containing protein [Acidobacteriota bacterium]
MSDFQASTTFNEKMRRIRFRRTREKTRFRDELRLIPKWLVAAVILLFIVAQVGFFIANMVEHAMSNPPGQIFPYPNDPALSIVAIAALIMAISIPVSAYFFLVGYINRDAKRRGMNSTLWTLLVLVLSPAWLFLGFFIYFLMREPLPYNCPQCGTTVGARFNYCPNCKCNLRPSCPQCKREVGELDKFCPYCGTELHAANTGTTAPPPAPPDIRGVL